MTDKQRENCLVLAAFLRDLPAEKFDMVSWKCGTTACAVGWAASLDHFKEQGLALADGDVYEMPCPTMPAPDGSDVRLYGYDTAQELFGFCEMFYPRHKDRDNDPQMVADELEDLAMEGV